MVFVAAEGDENELFSERRLLHLSIVEFENESGIENPQLRILIIQFEELREERGRRRVVREKE